MSNSGDSAACSFLLICQTYPPVMGGSEIEAQRVCEALLRRGHQIKVVCAGGEPMPPLMNWTDPKGVPVRMYAGQWKGVLKNVVFALRVAGMLIRERRNYQFVYFLMQGLHVAAGLPVARLLGKPILMKIAGSGVVPLMRKSRAGRLELWFLRHWAQCVMILNEGMFKEAIEVGFAPHQLLWMPNPVPTDEFAPCSATVRHDLRLRCGIAPGATVILFCGRLAPEKALPSLLDAFALLSKQIPESTLVLVGDGPLRTTLARQVDRLQLPEKNVRFIGSVAPEEVRLWLQIADIFTLVSVSEGFACALVEAMSTGLPSVVSDIPANRQLIRNGTHGFLVPVGNAEAIADALLRLLLDSKLRIRMGQAARQSVLDNYSTNQVADRYEALFRQVLGERFRQTRANGTNSPLRCSE